MEKELACFDVNGLQNGRRTTSEMHELCAREVSRGCTEDGDMQVQSPSPSPPQTLSLPPHRAFAINGPAQELDTTTLQETSSSSPSFSLFLLLPTVFFLLLFFFFFVLLSFLSTSSLRKHLVFRLVGFFCIFCFIF